MFFLQALDHGGDPEKFREDLMNIARTTLSSKILSQHKDFFSKMAVDAVLRCVLLVYVRVPIAFIVLIYKKHYIIDIFYPFCVYYFRLKKSSNLDAIQIIKVQGGTLEESFLDEGKIKKN